MLYLPSTGASSIEPSRVSEIYRQQGLRVNSTRMSGETGLYHFLQLLTEHKLKVFGSLTNFVAEYRVGDLHTPLLQCCWALLVSGRQYMRAKPEPRFIEPLPPVYRGPNGWMI